MKTKASMKITNNYDVVLKAPYCDASYLLRDIDPVYYNAGVYGWNNDIYIDYFNGKRIAITTGYRNLRGNTINYDLLRKYEDQAREAQNHCLQWDEIQDINEGLRYQLYKELGL